MARKAKQTTQATLSLGDAMTLIKDLPSGSVDCICTDLPYGTTQNKWDSVIPLDAMWAEFNRVLRPGGTVVLTAAQPFTSLLVVSNMKQFKYEIIWEKTIGSGQLNIKRQPLRVHESVLIFQKPSSKTQKPVYNEQKTAGEPYKITRSKAPSAQGYGAQKTSTKDNTGFRHARTVIKVANPRVRGGHPTQKPVELMEILVKTYTNPGDVVLDICMGSGTTGVACLNLNRTFVGFERDPKYFKMAQKRMEALSEQ